MEDNNLNKIAKILSSGPSKISVDKERSNFGDVNDDMQLLNSSNNQKNNNDNNSNSKIEVKIEGQVSNSDNKQIKTEQNVQNNINKFKIDNDMNINIKDNILTENNINQNGKDGENNGKHFSPLKIYKDYNIDKNAKTLDKMKGNALSKEMILKGLDEQDKENKSLIYSSRNNKYNFDRKKFLKLNFSFISNKKDDILNRSLHTLPNERNFLNDEIEENIIIDNSVDNINIKEIKVKKFETEENERIPRPIKLENKLNINNNNSIEINELKLNNKIDINDDESKNKKENNDNNIEEDICEITSNNNENKSKNENINKRRENALNTVMYNVGENNQVGGDIKNDKNSQNKNSITNNNSENVNKSFEEEHVFDKNNEKGNEIDKNKEKKDNNNDNNNDNYDDGDDIIDIDYDKI